VQNHKEVAAFLIAKGADVNASSKDLGTPLHWGAGHGDKELVELLIAKGANVNAKISGGTPRDWAIRSGHKEIAKILSAHSKTGKPQER
jgi:cytohesin